MSIYKKVMDLCKKNHISVRQLEREAHLGHATIAKWDKSSPTVKSVKKVADYFDIDICDLVGSDG